MERITLINLLEKINDKTQPSEVIWDGHVFKWKEYGYSNDNYGSLMTRLGLTLTDRALAQVYFEYEEKILDDIEKEYLRMVIKPFRENVKYIVKTDYFDDHKNEYLSVTLKGDDSDDSMVFPLFEKGKMYRGMEINKHYSLEELGL